MCNQADEVREQFVALFVRHEAAIHSFVLTLVPDLDEAEDVVQQASLTMWRRFDQFQPGTSFRNWAFQVAKYTAMNHLTKLKRDRHVFEASLLELLADRAAQRSEQLESQRRALAYCIERMSAADRHVLVGCYEEHGSVRQFAQRVGRSANAVYKHLHRLRVELLACAERRLGSEAAT